VSTMNTGDVTRRIGLVVTTELIKALGFKPVGQDKRATLFAQSDYPAMCKALAKWVAGKAEVPMQPKPVRKEKGSKASTAAGKPATTVNDDDDL
jgi:hypothetical protein